MEPISGSLMASHTWQIRNRPAYTMESIFMNCVQKITIVPFRAKLMLQPKSPAA